MNKYRFLDENGQHLHQLFSERKNEWENLTGATTIIDVLGKVLTWWASGLAVGKLGWTNSRIKVGGKYQNIPLEQRLSVLSPIREEHKKLSDADYLSLLDEAYKAHSVRLDETAEAGTNLHSELERFVRNQILTQRNGMIDATDYDEKITPYIDWSKKNVKRYLYSEAHCYDELLFVGGITDAGAELNDGSFAIIDFKSAKEAYFNYFVQAAIYHLLIKKNGLLDKDGNKNELGKLPEFNKYIIVPFGAKDFVVVENTNIIGLSKAAVACVELYRQKSFFENQ